jgi:hypothetical protein
MAPFAELLSKSTVTSSALATEAAARTATTTAIRILLFFIISPPSFLVLAFAAFAPYRAIIMPTPKQQEQHAFPSESRNLLRILVNLYGNYIYI